MPISDLHMPLCLKETKETTDIGANPTTETNHAIEEANKTETGLTASKDDKKESGSKKTVYRDYTNTQIEGFLKLLNNGVGTMSAAKQLGISKTSAYRFRKEWMTNGQVFRKKRGPAEGTMSPLKSEHTEFIMKYIKTSPNATLERVREELQKEFESLKTSKSALQRHMKDNCVLAMRRQKKESVMDQTINKE
ncbi:hypothetical protein BDF21DRAFT_402421 [Thamnidium elegans]|uniref:Uncharacterized protein n=1 Tax=Thamnidium elegans TaxID=101142 RepID=A0A8H7SSD4_9FUNG|nr:hypothetical protein INT48_007155 [Thamnidium elegans]KAI8065009.1 hypothetical protein BDF21DRAFT_402421 [Thamnidium elegans]